MKKLLAALGLSVISLLGLVAVPVSAQDISRNICESAGGTYTDGECTQADTPGLFDSGGVVRNVINIMLFIIGIIAVIMLIVGAIRYVTSGGDPNSTKGAKDTILYALIGLAVAFMAFAIINFVISSINDDSRENSFINVTELV